MTGRSTGVEDTSCTYAPVGPTGPSPPVVPVEPVLPVGPVAPRVVLRDWPPVRPRIQAALGD
jgi:hypothetical protein